MRTWSVNWSRHGPETFLEGEALSLELCGPEPGQHTRRLSVQTGFALTSLSVRARVIRRVHWHLERAFLLCLPEHAIVRYARLQNEHTSLRDLLLLPQRVLVPIDNVQPLRREVAGRDADRAAERVPTREHDRVRELPPHDATEVARHRAVVVARHAEGEANQAVGPGNCRVWGERDLVGKGVRRVPTCAIVGAGWTEKRRMKGEQLSRLFKPLLYSAP